MAKRGHGEGMIRERADGRWEARITLENGKAKSFYGKTRREVQQKLDEARRAQKQGQDLGQPSQRVRDYLHHWLEDDKRTTVRPSTYDSYVLNVHRLVPYIGHYRLDALKPAHIQHAYAKLAEEGLAARSVDQAHRTLRAALRQAVRLGLISRNPIEPIKPPRSEEHPMKVLDPEQVRLLLAQTDDPWHPLWALLVTTGLRIGEATALRWSDLDLEKPTATVQRTLHRRNGEGMVSGPPKTNQSRRTVRLANHVAQALRNLQLRQKENSLRHGQPWSDEQLVFCTREGGPLDPGYLRDSLHRCLDRAGLPHIRIHDLRHTAASYLLQNGTHIKVVQELLGHSSVTLTLNTYSHVLPRLHEQVANDMDRLFG